MFNEKRQLSDLFEGVTAYFSPRIIGEVNSVYIKIAKVKGDDIPWHSHANEDEMFYVVKGEMTIELRTGKPSVLREGDVFIVSKGTEHRVYADRECWIMLIENKETRHTGDVQSAITRSVDEQMY